MSSSPVLFSKVAVVGAFVALLGAPASANSSSGTSSTTLFNQDFSQCNWTADDLSERSCGFRLGTPPVGTYQITSGAMKIRVTAAQDASRGHHHTEIEPIVSSFTNGRFANYDRTYTYTLSTRLHNWARDDQWEIITQWHGVRDSGENPRNPPVALLVRDGRYQLNVRADADRITPPSGTPHRYDREEVFDLGPIDSNTWVDWTFRFNWDYSGKDGQIVIWKDGVIVHEEYGLANTFNDVRGVVWTAGVYKFFKNSDISVREISLDNMSVVEGAGGDFDPPPSVPAIPRLSSISAVTEDGLKLTWQDKSNNERGFILERRADADDGWEEVASVPEDSTEFTDSGLDPDTTYRYRVSSFNSAGISDPSNSLSATTLDGIELRAFGYKKRGYHKVFLTHYGLSDTSVDILRDNEVIASTSEEVHLDEINTRGKASYRYKVCDSTNHSICSPVQIISF